MSMTTTRLPTVDALDQVMEDTPVTAPPVDAKESMSLGQIRDAKESHRQRMFADDGDGKLRVRQGNDTTALPCVHSCVVRLRGSALFSACVAREPETPLTESSIRAGR